MLEQAIKYSSTAVTENWISRDGKGPQDHGPGMSYCYGCKDTIETFNAEVVDCPPETTSQIVARETNANETKYRGNLGTLNGQSCQVGGQNHGKWPGLYSQLNKSTQEEDAWASHKPNSAAFNPAYWVGIDCSGLVQRAIGAAKSFAADTGLSTLVTIPFLSKRDVNSQHYFPRMWVYVKDAKGNFVGQWDNSDNKKRGSSYVFYVEPAKTASDKIKQQHKLHKGDLVQYKGHIAIVYSETGADNGSYLVIHAFGDNRYNKIVNGVVQSKFGRKVLVTKFTVLPTALGYGRIRLWQ